MDRVLACAESTNLSTAAVIVLISFILWPVAAENLHPVLTVISAPPSGAAGKIMPPTHEEAGNVFSWDRFQCDDYIDEGESCTCEDTFTLIRP
jgi:hypothetical protein